MKRSKSKPVELDYMIPTIQEENHFEMVKKAQITTAFLDHCLEKGSHEHNYCKGNLETSPPAVDPIKMYTPKITMFKLMSASDNSATGIGQLMEQILEQLGVESFEFGKWLQVVEGDMGTNLNFEGAARKRYPSGYAEEGLQNLSFGIAGTHTMWNITSAIVNAYMGDTEDSEDPGISRCAASLNIKAEHLVDKSDFGLLMQTVHKVQTATYVFLLK